MNATLSLAWPVGLSELGWIMMAIVDTIVVGPLGPAAIGAVGTGSTIFFALAVLGIGTLFALDTFVAQGFGAGHFEECHRWLVAGLWLAASLSVVLVAIGFVGACAAAASRHAKRSSRAPPALPRCVVVVHAAAARLHGLPPLSPGDGAREASDGLDRARQRRQRGRELDLRLRPFGHARIWDGWIGVGNVWCPHLPGRGALACCRVDRTSSSLWTRRGAVRA